MSPHTEEYKPRRRADNGRPSVPARLSRPLNAERRSAPGAVPPRRCRPTSTRSRHFRLQRWPASNCAVPAWVAV